MMSERRRFLTYLGGLAAFTTKSASAQSNAPAAMAGPGLVPGYARAQSYRSLKQSTYEQNGGNADSRKIPPGGSINVFESDGPGVITHIWFTIAAQSGNHLKEVVLRVFWDGNDKPSVETPVG